MKLKWFFVVICLSFFLLLTNGEKVNLKVAYAINEIIEKHFASQDATRPGNVDIVLFGEVFYEVGSMLEMKSKTTKITIYKYDKLEIENGFYELRESSIVFFESLEWFKKCVPMVKWAFHRKQRHQHLVRVPGLTPQEIIETFTDGFAIDHVSFLVENTEKSIELHTTWMFTEVVCRELQIAQINRFDFDTMEWENSNFYPKKYENFHGCALTFSLYYFSIIKLYFNVFDDKLNATLVPVVSVQDEWKFCDLTGMELPLG